MSQEMVLAPVDSGFTVGLVAIAVALLVSLVILGALSWSATRARLTVDAGSLRLSGVYGRTIARSAIVAAGVRQLGDGDGELQPVRRTNGLALGGVRSGWFRLRNGDKALLAVTNPRRVVYVPTTLGYALLVSPEHPAQLIDALNPKRQ